MLALKVAALSAFAPLSIVPPFDDVFIGQPFGPVALLSVPFDVSPAAAAAAVLLVAVVAQLYMRQ